MKKVITLFAVVVMIASFSNTVKADNGVAVSATATGTATIVSPLAISKTVDMNFGNVARSTALGTVVLGTDGSRTITGGVTLPVSAGTKGTISAASFALTGEGAYTYAITLPSGATTLTSSSNTMTIDAFTSNPTGTGALISGTGTLLVGATLHVAANQANGEYVSGTAFTVTVNYN